MNVVCLCCLGCMYSFGYAIIFVMQIIFSMNVVNTKVVYNLLILLVQRFYDFRPDGLGVIDFTSLLSAFACALNRSELLYCLPYLNMESCIGDNRRVVLLLLRFPKYLRASLLLARTPVIVVQSGMAGSVQIWTEMPSWC